MELIKEGYSDFLALNYYASDGAKACPMEEGKEIRYSGVNWSGKKGDMNGFETHPGFYEMCKNPNLDTTDWDWAIDPTGLEYIFRDIYTRYNKPLMITENGLGAYDTLTEDGHIHDKYRIAVSAGSYQGHEKSHGLWRGGTGVLSVVRSGSVIHQQRSQKTLRFYLCGPYRRRSEGMRPSAQGFLLLVSESDSVQGNGVGLRKQEEK